MPIYEYKCKVCDHKFEEFKEMDADPVKICPECGGEVKQLISLSSSQLGLCNGNAKEYYEMVIKPDAKRIADKIKSGDEDTAADIFGTGE